MNLYPALAELAQGDTRAAAEARRILTVHDLIERGWTLEEAEALALECEHADLIGASSCQ
jgi:hypoxanthine-guanine phosphoribosyltransferase